MDIVIKKDTRHSDLIKDCSDFISLPDGTLTGEKKYCGLSVDRVINGVVLPGCKMIDFDENGSIIGYKAEWVMMTDIDGSLMCGYLCTGNLEKDKNVDDRAT